MIEQRPLFLSGYVWQDVWHHLLLTPNFSAYRLPTKLVAKFICRYRKTGTNRFRTIFIVDHGSRGFPYDFTLNFTVHLASRDMLVQVIPTLYIIPVQNGLIKVGTTICFHPSTHPPNQSAIQHGSMLLGLES